MKKLHYGERNCMALDKAGGYYIRHVSAMTGEGLHAKSAIAAELAWRDAEIDARQAKIDALMFEYCPGEMTKEQVYEWKQHQRAIES